MAYTTIDDPSAYFQTALYTGNANYNTITNDGNSNLGPDLIWGKCRSTSKTNFLYDTTRGVEKRISSDSTGAEASNTNGVLNFYTDGFRLGSGNAENDDQESYVAWQWKANGGTTSSNTQGNVTNTLQVNSTAGFSISTFTSASSGNTTIGHGLGVAPSMFVVKGRNIGFGWWMNHAGLTNQSDRYLGLHAVNGEQTLSWGAAPTSTLITMSPGFVGNGYTLVCYAFAEKQGYSKFGKYAGNENANGPFIYTGFKPACIIIKNATVISNWRIFDNKRPTYNTALRLMPNSSSAEQTDTQIDILSNGFKIRASDSEINSGVRHIYMAFAENPFTTSTGVPACAR